MSSNNIELGRLGEQIAVEYLQKERFEVLSRNFRASHNELDIIVRDAFSLRIVEVKTRRSSADTVPYSLNPKKLKSLKIGAISFISSRHDLRGLEIYFDLIVVVIDSCGGYDIEYTPDFVRF